MEEFQRTPSLQCEFALDLLRTSPGDVKCSKTGPPSPVAWCDTPLCRAARVIQQESYFVPGELNYQRNTTTGIYLRSVFDHITDSW